MTLEFIELKDDPALTVEDYLDAIEKNHATAIKMKEEMLPIFSNKKVESKEEIVSIVENDNQISDSINQDFEDEVQFYLAMLLGIKDQDFTEDEIAWALPSRNNPNFQNILMRICAEYLKDIKEVEEFIDNTKKEFSAEGLEEFKSIIEGVSNRISVIQNFAKEEENQEIRTKNNLIFVPVPTQPDKIRVLEDLKGIDNEYYDSFIGLFDSIVDGSFKNAKMFRGGDTIRRGMCEVKDFKIRVVFNRIGKNDYALITAFVKKTDVDISYSKQLELRIKNYLDQKSEIKEKLQDQDFLNQNEVYKDELYSLLRNSRKGKTKIKGGTLDGTNNK